ncbi:C-type Lectin CRL-like isoform X2 [Erythrolamprus reginae]|uniref:C-type Lectin CRL-like isoform X2 n=1 Tax=Erythrolamprus reginae TaxID=121349 RepID=UPI00396CBF35
MLLITCFIFGFLGSFTWAGPPARTVCSPEAFALKSRSRWYCYKFYDDQLTFEEAEQECQFRWKGHLASFNSETQAKSIGAYVAQKNLKQDSVWIGFREGEGLNGRTKWLWTDGSAVPYTNLSGKKPDNCSSSTELCASLSPQSGQWNKQDCNRELAFLCKWKPT